MKILNNTIKEIKELNPDEILKINDMIMRLKNNRKKDQRNSTREEIRLRVVDALKSCKSDFSNEIIDSREDRI